MRDSSRSQRAPVRPTTMGRLLWLGPLLGLLLSGCSVRQMATDALADAIAQSGSVYAMDDDIELVEAATPFGLKTIEALLAESPRHRGLLLAAARGFTQYAYAFVAASGERLEDHDIEAAQAAFLRCRRLYLRARDYGLRAIETKYADFGSLLRAAPEEAAGLLTPADVPGAYWTAVPWAAAIALGKDEPELLGELPQIDALIRRAIALDEGFDAGAIHTFLISYEMAQATDFEQRAELARAHYERAVALSQGLQAAPHVAYAEAVTVAKQDRDAFSASLAEALAVDPAGDPARRLSNVIMQRRASWLLGRTEYYFLD